MALRNKRPAESSRGPVVRNVPPAQKEPSRLEQIQEQYQQFISSPIFVKRVAWLAFLAAIYVGLQNYYDRLTYDISRAKKEMDEVKAVYISRNAEYMLSSKQSEISKRLASHGLDKNIVPPITIQIEE